jgi:DNA gyrase subunit A
MIGFGSDQVQAEYVAEIKLRNINREYILKRVEETKELEREIADLQDILANRRRIRTIITDELKQVMKKHGSPRRTGIVYADEVEPSQEEESAEDYPVQIFLSRGGYFKKITPLSLRLGGEQKYKEDDGPSQSFEASNRGEILVFTDRQQVYKARLGDFEDMKASQLGVFLPAHLGMDENESVVAMLSPGDYAGQVLLIFENGKAARLELSAYATKTNRRRLTGAYSAHSPLRAVIPLEEDFEAAVYSDDGRALVFSTALLQPKTSRTTQGVSVMSLKPRRRILEARLLADTPIKNVARYRVRTLPAAGALLREEDRGEEQLSLTDEGIPTGQTDGK